LHDSGEKMSPIKIVFFDIGGVYAKGTGSYVINRVSCLLNSRIEDVQKIFHDIWSEFGIGNIAEEEYYQRLSSKLGIDTKTLAEMWTAEEMFAINPDIESIIIKLKGKNYTVASITDVDPVHLKIHLEKGNYKIFDFVIDSVNAKSTKRSGKDIYRKAIEMAKAKPHECVMIDDTPEKLVAAKELGIHTILFESAEKLRNDLNHLGVDF